MIRKTIYLLIGPKGSGKTHIGMMMKSEFGVRFVRVEEWAKEIRRDRDIDDASYIREVFHAIERGVRAMLVHHDEVAFESTGTTDAFGTMLKSLQEDHTVITIGVDADDETCLQRVGARDRSEHVDVSDDQVRLINRAVREKELKTDAVIVNQGRTDDQLRGDLAAILRKH